MKQIITATASLILILSVFSNILCIQEIKMKQTELKVSSIRYIERVKRASELDDIVKDAWKEKAAKIFKCDKSDIEIISTDYKYNGIKHIEVELHLNIEELKDRFGIVKGQKEMKVYFDIRCDG
jgi:hypothetical protein